jgi:hypothetical protein
MVHRHTVTPARFRSPPTTERAPSAYRVTGKARSSGPLMAATTPLHAGAILPPSALAGGNPRQGIMEPLRTWRPPSLESSEPCHISVHSTAGAGPQRPTGRCHVTTADPRWLGHGPWSNPATQGIGCVRCPRERTGAVPHPRVPGRPPPHRRPRPTGSLPRWSGRVRPALHRGRRCR